MQSFPLIKPVKVLIFVDFIIVFFIKYQKTRKFSLKKRKKKESYGGGGGTNRIENHNNNNNK